MNNSGKKDTMNGDKVAIARLMVQLASRDKIIAEQQQKIADYERFIQSMAQRSATFDIRALDYHLTPSVDIKKVKRINKATLVT